VLNRRICAITSHPPYIDTPTAVLEGEQWIEGGALIYINGPLTC
jgi:hypothetical protein